MTTLLCLLLVLKPVVHADVMALHTGTREVVAISAGEGGEVVIATTGGLVVRSPGGAWTKRTRLDGLSAGEAGALDVRGAELKPRWPSVQWRGALWTAGPTAIQGPDGKRIPLPASSGSHVSAMAADATRLVAAMFGDGLYEWRGVRWLRVPVAAPDATALALQGGQLWIGTRKSGWLEPVRGRWQSHVLPGEIPWHNVQALQAFEGWIYAGTLEDGLLALGPRGWEIVAECPSKAPRQMLAFQGKLYVRDGNGVLNGFDGANWTLGLQSALPRKQANALATDGDTLFVAQWGGWSELQGQAWRHRFEVEELQGTQVTVLAASGNALWVGTQGAGLFRVDRASRKVRAYDVRHGLGDDWVTALHRLGEDLYVGTFAGGLFRIDARGELHPVPGLARLSIKDLSSSEGTLWVATTEGLWAVRNRAASPVPLATPSGADLDVREGQAVLAAQHVWFATRTGLYQLKPRFTVSYAADSH